MTHSFDYGYTTIASVIHKSTYYIRNDNDVEKNDVAYHVVFLDVLCYDVSEFYVKSYIV